MMDSLYSGPLPDSLRKYDAVIDQIIREMGVEGKMEEFKDEGKQAVYKAETAFYSIITDMNKDTYMYCTIRQRFLELLGS
ncbi:MAG: hypothetical protein WAM07_07215 [Halobacillus sp.]|uniref:hypothetical protein n=1 Tax=Halobacillus sp. TaxID=56800 RepID=UPI003BAF996F